MAVRSNWPRGVRNATSRMSLRPSSLPVEACEGIGARQMSGCLLFTRWWLYKVGDKSYECGKQSPTQYYGQLGLFISILLAQSQTASTPSQVGEMWQAPDTQVPALSINMANRQQKIVGNLRISPLPLIYLWQLRELWKGRGAWTSHLPPVTRADHAIVGSLVGDTQLS